MELRFVGKTTAQYEISRVHRTSLLQRRSFSTDYSCKYWITISYSVNSKTINQVKLYFYKKKDEIRCNVWLKIFPLGGAKISAWPCKFKARTSSRGFSLEPNESIISHTFPILIDHSSFFALFFTNFHFHREGPELVDTRDCILFF